MIHRLATAPRRLNRNREVLDHLRLSGKVREALRPECRFKFGVRLLPPGAGERPRWSRGMFLSISVTALKKL